MNGLFHNCPILTSIDISSFETILSEVSLFGNEADNGKLIVQKDLNPGSVYIINNFQTIYSSNVKNDLG